MYRWFLATIRRDDCACYVRVDFEGWSGWRCYSTFGLVHVSPVLYLISSNIYLESTETSTVVPVKWDLEVETSSLVILHDPRAYKACFICYPVTLCCCIVWSICTTCRQRPATSNALAVERHVMDEGYIHARWRVVSQQVIRAPDVGPTSSLRLKTQKPWPFFGGGWLQNRSWNPYHQVDNPTIKKTKLLPKQKDVHRRMLQHCRSRGWDVDYSQYWTIVSRQFAMQQLSHRHWLPRCLW